MTQRNDLVRAVQTAPDGRALSRAVAALDTFDRDRAGQLAAGRDLDLGARIAAQRLTPVPIHEHHTAATDWLADYQEPAGDGYRTAMYAEAASWYRRLDPAVRADGEELAEQAHGRARVLASQFGPQARRAVAEFLSVVGYLRQSDAASGLPQIDQTVDPNNAPSPTPYPAEVFPTFGEDQDPFNANVEGMNHDSQVSSQQAPLIQQVMQQNAGGSGYGSGPERPDTHDTGFDTSNSYAEVPLGPAGQIPTAPGGGEPMGSSQPNPVAGTQQDAGAEKRPTVAAIAGYSMPDPFGYRWAMQADVHHPFHERCGSAHWPDEACGDRAHTASLAVGYLTDIDGMRRVAACEAAGIQEGLKAVRASHSAAELGAWHNRVTAAWGETERTADDSAVLHGFMAVVRPVLAEMSCTACKGGDCAGCTDPDCGCAKHPRGHSRTAAGGLAAGGGVSQSEREHATHHLPGTDKFPVSSAADVENGKHDIGRTNEPRDKVVSYLDEMAKIYHTAPVGG